MTSYVPPQPQQRDVDTGNKLEFFIPKDKAGGVIGKGGQILRDLQTETGCRIRLDRDEIQGMRRVIVRHEDDAVMLRAKEKILDVVAAAHSDNSAHGNDA
jgi:rRNA processing protein Krr1/Pno1